MSATEYTFLPAMRRGLASLVSGQEGWRGTIEVDVELDARDGDRGTDRLSASKRVALYGPGDVRGFDDRVVVRTDPRSSPEIGDFEPNYFPFIEFADPDFAWRYSPDVTGQEAGKLQPWICLVALQESEFDEGAGTDENLLPWIRVKRHHGILPLPKLDQAWQWAHVQIIGAAAEDSDEGDEPLVDGDGQLQPAVAESVVRDEPHRAVCRLLCPRRLWPKKRYTAFVVPSFALGVYAGRGRRPPPDMPATTPAWIDTSDDVELPYYYKWSFGTGLRGDFEYAVRLLKPRKLDAIGVRDLDCSAPGFGLAGVNRSGGEADRAHIVGAQGALRSITPDEEDESDNEGPDDDFRKALAALLNGELKVDVPESDFFSDVRLSVAEWGRGARISWRTAKEATFILFYGVTGTEHELDCRASPPRLTHVVDVGGRLIPGTTYRFTVIATASGEQHELQNGTFTVPVFPTVLPPMYGRWHAARSYVSADDASDKPWLDELNLDPRYRVAAGLGAQIVRKQQSALMASAWDQLGSIEVANDIIRRAQFGLAASGALYEKLAQLGLDDFFQVTGPLHPRTRLDRCERPGPGLGKTAYVHFKTRSAAPIAAFDPTFRRIARPRGPFRKRQARTAGPLIQALHSGRLSSAGKPDTPGGALTIDVVEGRLDEGDRTFTERDAGELSDAIAARGTTAAGVLSEALTAIDALEAVPPIEAPPSASLDDVREAMLCALDPALTICERVQARVDSSRARERAGCLDRIMAYPEFPQPLYRALMDMSQDLIAPGLDKIPHNTVGVLITNRHFIESFQLGFNHEFAGELLWRGYPTDQRGSYSRQFWDPGDSLPPGDQRDEEGLKRWRERHKDVLPLHEWEDELGEHRVQLDEEDPIEERVVLVVRGDLLKKYPNTRIYAVKARQRVEGTSHDSGGNDDGNGEEKVEVVPCLPEFDDDRGSCDDAEPITPVFTAHVPPDITLLGFDFDVETARGSEASTAEDSGEIDHGRFIVFEGRPMEARFGFDEPVAHASQSDETPSTSGPSDSERVPVTDWQTWADVPTNDQLGAGVDVPDLEDRAQYVDLSDYQGTSSATIARVTLQRAFRMSVHARRLIPT